MYKRVMAPLLSRIQSMLGRGILSATDDSQAMQHVKVTGLAGEVLDSLPHPQPFGFTSHCPSGGEAVMVFLGGSRDHGTVLMIDNSTHRKTDLAEGESCMYSKAGTHVYLKKDGTIEIETNGHVLQINGDVSISGKVSANGDISSGGDVKDAIGTLDQVRQDLAALRTAYNAHAHPVTAISSPTGPATPQD